MTWLIALLILDAGWAAAAASEAAKPPSSDLSDYVNLHVTRNEGARRALSCRGMETTQARQ